MKQSATVRRRSACHWESDHHSLLGRAREANWGGYLGNLLVLAVIAVLLNLVFTTRAQFKHTSVAFQLSAESLTVRVGKHPRFSRAPTTWARVGWKDLLAVHTTRQHRRTQLDLDLRTGAVITTDDGAPLGIPLHNLYCGDPFRNAAVLRRFLSADRTRIGWTQVADEANRIAADDSV